MGYYNYIKPSSPKPVIIPMGQGYNHVNRAPDSSDKRPRKFSDISTTNIKPSKDFSDLEWDSFLKHGSPSELENDKISSSTYNKIKGELNR
jgi:hypothetical protein